MALHEEAPRQLQALLDLHGIDASNAGELDAKQRVAILDGLYRILDILDAKTNHTLNLNVIILTAQVFIASQSTQMPRWAQAILFLLVLVPLIGTVWALQVFHVQGGAFLRWRGSGCTLVFPSGRRSGSPGSREEAMWDEFRALALLCDERCRKHYWIRRWTIASGVALLLTILAVVTHIGYGSCVTSERQAARPVAVSAAELVPADHELLMRAREVATRAYTPYSKFAVGAAARARSGAVYAGANMENASYGLTLCAEASALLQSVAAGDFDIEAIAIVGGPLDQTLSSRRPVTPCGRCRQLILEASHVAKVDIRVISANRDLSLVSVRPISQLLPDGFGPDDLA